MKIFLCWSGEMSHKVAGALRDWLPYVIQSLKPFISTEDIDKGERWSDTLADELNDTAYGIICITPYNINAPWVNFEAGAISKAIHRSYVSPFLFRVQSSMVRGPLQQFQFTKYDKEDIFNLLSSINNRLGPEDQLTHELLRREFDVWWPELKETLDKVTDTQEIETETGFNWLYSADDLERVQASIDCKWIWVITPNLYRRTIHPKVRSIVEKNLEHGIGYTFIIPSSSKVDVPEEDLRVISTLKADQVFVKEIPDEEFHRLAVTDYIILNPDYDDHHPLHVFLELPTVSRGYWIEVDIEASVGFVSRFRKLATRE